MKNLDNFVNQQFRKIPYSEQKENIMKDIKQNLEEKVIDLMKQGKSEEDAINKVIVEFGDMEDIKKELGGNQPTTKEKARIQLGFSICGSILIIALFLFINLYYTPGVIWFVYPIFAILWWPLAMFFWWYSRK
jgi:Uncharacterized protein involved in biosynthesis of c-type cytochromes